MLLFVYEYLISFIYILRCKTVEVVKNFNLEAFASKPWFIQAQAVTAYLPETRNYCVSARYKIRDSPTLLRYTVDVINQAYDSSKTDLQQGNLCAVQSGDEPAKLTVAPCFIPSIFGGPFWVVGYDEGEGYALISGGQPSHPTGDGLCTNGSSANDAGLWIFTRKQERDEMLLTKSMNQLKDMGFDTGVLNAVDQTDCPSLDGIENLPHWIDNEKD